MSTRVETTRVDYDRDGMTDDLTTVTYEFTGDKLVTRTSVLEDLNGGGNLTTQTQYTYNEAGQNVGETHFTNNWGTDLQFAHAVEREFDANGRVQTEYVKSPDFDGNGTLDDYVTITNFAYDAAGRMTFKRTDNTAWGGQGNSDYREETWSYDSSGRLLSHNLDDPMMFDCEINRSYHYKNGVLQNIKEQNDIRYGDERPRIDESFHKYDSEGRATLHTSWADHSDMGWMQRVDTTFSWANGYDNATALYDFEGDGKAEHKKYTEHWFNADGNLTHTLVSYDFGNDGGPLANGYDSRDLFVKTWSGDTLVAETHDYGADGVLEFQFESHLLVA